MSLSTGHRGEQFWMEGDRLVSPHQSHQRHAKNKQATKAHHNLVDLGTFLTSYELMGW